MEWIVINTASEIWCETSTDKCSRSQSQLHGDTGKKAEREDVFEATDAGTLTSFGPAAEYSMEVLKHEIMNDLTRLDVILKHFSRTVKITLVKACTKRFHLFPRFPKHSKFISADNDRICLSPALPRILETHTRNFVNSASDVFGTAQAMYIYIYVYIYSAHFE